MNPPLWISWTVLRIYRRAVANHRQGACRWAGDRGASRKRREPVRDAGREEHRHDHGVLDPRWVDDGNALRDARSGRRRTEERRVGKECGSTCGAWWWAES